MRLICPNCGAQYEVPDSVIPETGRDVQCSSCGHTWFQRHAQQEDAAQDAADQTAADDLWDDEDDEDDRSLFAETSADPAPAPETSPEPSRAAPAQQPAAQQPPAQQPESQTARDTAPAQRDSDDTDHTPEDEWQGFPTDPGLTDAPRPGTALVPDPEDPVSRLPEVDEDDYEEDPARDLPTPRRSLDTSVADLLREEAEREARARAAERGAGLESQPDLGLDSAPSRPTGQDADALRRAEEARLRMVRLRGEDAPEASPTPAPPQTQARPQPQTPPPAPQTMAAARRAEPDEDRITAAAAAALAESRRALLPDIEEINSSLRSTSDRRPARADDHDTPGHYTDPRQVTVEEPRGFNRGFSITLLLAMILLALYIFAPALAEAVPAAAPVVEVYVAAVDNLRVMLDAQFQKLSLWLAGIAGSTG